MVLLECRRRGRGRSPTVDANVTLRDPGDSAIGVRGNAGSEPESASMAGATTTPWVRPDELCARKDKKRHRGSSLKRRVRIRIPYAHAARKTDIRRGGSHDLLSTSKGNFRFYTPPHVPQ